MINEFFFIICKRKGNGLQLTAICIQTISRSILDPSIICNVPSAVDFVRGISLYLGRAVFEVESAD